MKSDMYNCQHLALPLVNIQKGASREMPVGKAQRGQDLAQWWRPGGTGWTVMG